MQKLSLVCLSLFLGMVSSVNSLELQLSCGGSHAPEHCVYEEGEMILINCSIVSFPSNFKPHNDSSSLLNSVYFKHDRKILNHTTVRRVSTNTVQLLYPNDSPSLEGYVICNMSANVSTPGYNNFCSTRKPTVPTVIGCSRNTSQDTVTCSWSPTVEVENRDKSECGGWNFVHTLFWRFNRKNSDGSDLDWQRCPNASDGVCQWDDVSQFFDPDNGELCVYVVAQSVSYENGSRPMPPHASQETCHDLGNRNHQITGLTGGDIAGIVCGAALLVCMVVMGIVAFRCCRRRWAKFVDGVKIEVPEAVTPNKYIQNYSKTNGYTVNGNDPRFMSMQPESPFMFSKDTATSPTVAPLLKVLEYENEAIGVKKADDYSKYHVLIASDDVNDDEEDITSYVRSYATVPSQDMSLLKNPVGAPGALVEPRLGESNPLQGNDSSVEYGLVSFDGVGIAPPGTTYYNVGDDVIQPPRNKMAHSPSTETNSSMESQPISNYITVEMVSPATSPTPQCDLISLDK